MLIRPERSGDFQTIHTLVESAFQTAEVSDGDEQDYVEQLRRGPAYIPELALVAERSGELIGHIMLTRTCVVDEPRRIAALLLSPLAVLFEHRCQRVGSALVEEALRRAAAMGHTAVFLVGDPAYYGRFGFRPSADYGIRHSGRIAESYVMALELSDGALAEMRGTIDIV